MKALFIALAIVFVVLLIFFILFPLIKKSVLKNRYISSYGRDIYHIANYYDYYLINRLLLKANDDSYIDIDHLLLANKYIFVIKDYYFEGSLLAKDNDNSWVYYFGNYKNPQKKLLNNLLKENDNRLKKLSMITGLDKSMLISVVLVNNDCDLKYQKEDSEEAYLIKRNELKKLIEQIEARDVSPLNVEQLSYAVHDIARLNERVK
ncbi:MAG: NERD domain-containing protein [Bacilli bacterium]|nr:NERD domain-containing protein [Bacilli bacterium]